jgi:quercetin dioxygenase-like cupin family protein
MLCAMACVFVGCAARAAHVVTPEGIMTVEALCASRPLAEGSDVRADLLARSEAASVHLVQVRGAEKPHRHAAHDLTVTMLRGQGVLRLGGAARVLRAGDVTFVPRGVPHWFTRTGADVVVTLAVFSPPLDAPDSVTVDDVDSPATAR